MKKLLSTTMITCSMFAYAQFPAPTNLEFTYQYFMIGEGGYCDGQWVYGPTYCSHFDWSPPDTSISSATLEYYNIYYNHWAYSDTILILYTSTTETFYDVEDGFIGELWVTAVYSDPDGESGKSNIIINPDLPISVEENMLNERPAIIFDQNSQLLRIEYQEKVAQINIFDSQGKRMKALTTSGNILSLEAFSSGLYIVEIITVDSDLIRRKIVK